MRVAAAGLLLKRNQVLLCRRSANRRFYPNVWDLIGGHCEHDESPDQTLQRELAEEIGIIVQESILLQVLKEPFPHLNGEYKYYVYLVTKWRGTPTNRQPDEHSEIRWLTIGKALNLDLAHPKYYDLLQKIQCLAEA